MQPMEVIQLEPSPGKEASDHCCGDADDVTLMPAEEAAGGAPAFKLARVLELAAAVAVVILTVGVVSICTASSGDPPRMRRTTPYVKNQLFHDECVHPVYCRGPFLHAVQMSGVYNDSKTFVDMPISSTPQTVLAAFARIADRYQENNYSALRTLLDENFLPAGHEIARSTPGDWKQAPSFLQTIPDPNLRDFAAGLNAVWLQLVRRYNHSGLCPSCFSSLNATHPFVVPGGRFREFYYWDTYWVLEGLYVSEMYDTATGMIANFADFIESTGFIPNGARLYYTNRSQPPLFCKMLERYLNVMDTAGRRGRPQASVPPEFFARAVKAAHREYDWWMSGSTVVSFGNRTLNRYAISNVTYPRPESYVEDVHTTAGYPDAVRDRMWGDIAGAAESGWDFSSRWLREKRAAGSIQSIRTSEVAPVDLNAILYHCETLLASWLVEIGQPEDADKCGRAAREREAALQSVFWSAERSTWLDVNLTSGEAVGEVYPSNFLPLWVGLRPPSGPAAAVLTAAKQLLFRGGVATSLLSTGQQWDFPNAWPALNQMLAEGLRGLPGGIGEPIAEQVLRSLVDTAYCGWQLTGGVDGGMFFEKYNATHPGLPGSGGEYTVQQGFGMTNGALLWALQRYGDTFTAPTACGQAASERTIRAVLKAAP
eukprot:gene8858-13729_t